MTFRTEQPVSPPPSKRHGQKEGQNAQSPQPLGETPPEQDALGHLVKTCEHGDARSGESRHGLEETVQVTGIDGDDERNGPDGRIADPSQGTNQHGLDIVQAPGTAVIP